MFTKPLKLLMDVAGNPVHIHKKIDGMHRDASYGALPTGSTVALAVEGPDAFIPLLMHLIVTHNRVLPVPCLTQTFWPAAEWIVTSAGARPIGSEQNLRPRLDETWCLACSSSGSLGPHRTYGYSANSIRGVVAWYQRIYDVDEDSLIVTDLPLEYNFTLMAGVFTALSSGATLAFGRTADWLRWPGLAQYRNVIVLSNPVLLSEFTSSAGDARHRAVLIDSGGAPLPSGQIAALRRRGWDLREGYGLTETLSLTHFDIEGTDASIGTVGRPLDGVEQQICHINGKPIVLIKTPHRAVLLNENLPGNNYLHEDWLNTRDLGEIDVEGRLRILGRSDDFSINGLWPRDSLDLLSEVLQPFSFSVSHPTGDLIRVRLLNSLDAQSTSKFREDVAAAVDLHPENVEIVGGARLLSSLKIGRNFHA
jgi:hypothetical protein